MTTLPCLPPPQVVSAFLSEWILRATQKEVAEKLNIRSRNTLTDWVKIPTRIQMGDLVNITNFARDMKFQSYRNWMDEVYAQDYPVITIKQESHAPHRKYACERVGKVPVHSAIFYGGDLCEYLGTNNKGEAQCRSRYSEVLYAMDAPPDHIVLGAVQPIHEKE